MATLGHPSTGFRQPLRFHLGLVVCLVVPVFVETCWMRSTCLFWPSATSISTCIAPYLSYQFSAIESILPKIPYPTRSALARAKPAAQGLASILLEPGISLMSNVHYKEGKPFLFFKRKNLVSFHILGLYASKICVRLLHRDNLECSRIYRLVICNPKSYALSVCNCHNRILPSYHRLRYKSVEYGKIGANRGF